MFRIRLFVLTLIALVSAFVAQAQTDAPDMASDLRSSGKIYIVVLVLATIFAGILAFLIYLERRINRLEQEIQQKD